VAHFRSFAPSSELPAAATTEGLYEELALSRKGVCRHRSYAFLVTAHRLGLPTRFVHNEAHAWVEVFDGRLWHRIDLGGAAGRIEYERPPEVPLHRPPSDAFPWPARSDPGATTPGLGRPPAGEPSEGPQDGAAPGSGQPGSPRAPTAAPRPTDLSETRAPRRATRETSIRAISCPASRRPTSCPAERAREPRRGRRAP